MDPFMTTHHRGAFSSLISFPFVITSTKGKEHGYRSNQGFHQIYPQ